MLISLAEYAALHGKSESAARRMALRGSFQTAQKAGRNWVVDQDEPWPDRRTLEARAKEAKLHGFEYDEDGYLIVDDIVDDPRFETLTFVRIKYDWYKVVGVNIHNTGRDFAATLIPTAYSKIDGDYQPSWALRIMAWKVRPRTAPKIKVGRAITEKEMESLMERYHLTQDDISEPFDAERGGIYGKEHAVHFPVVTIRFPTMDALRVETQLRSKGIEAWNGAPGYVDVRVDRK